MFHYKQSSLRSFLHAAFPVCNHFYNKKNPGRNPGRVLNPISYEKPVTVVSIDVPKLKCSAGAGFSEFTFSTSSILGRIYSRLD